MRDYTKGSIPKALLTLSVPIVLANVLQSAYQIIDTFWVGRLGAQAVAAVSLSFPVLFMVLSLGAGLAIGGSVLVSQSVGAKNSNQANHYATQATISVLIAATLLAIVGYFLSPFALTLLGTEPVVFDAAVRYLQISFIGMPFLFGYFIYMSISRAVGEVRTPVFIVLSTVILNLILDPLFIYGYKFIPANGVAGAAIASVITQALSMIVGFILLTRGIHGVHLSKQQPTFDWRSQKQILLIGFPASIDQTARAFGLILMAGLVSTLGTAVLAAYGIGLRVFSFIIIPAVGLSMATSTLVGQNIGAKQKERAKEVVHLSNLYSFWVLTVVGLIIFLFAEHIVRFFIVGEPAVVIMGTLFLRVMALSFGLLGIQFSIAGGFRGSGHTFKAMIITAISLFVVQLPAAYLLSKIWGELGIWLSIPLSNVIGAIIGLLWLRSGSWLQPTKNLFIKKNNL